MDLSNGKSLIINSQSHSGDSAHYFCHLHEYSAHKVGLQENRGITLRNYKTPTVSIPRLYNNKIWQISLGSGSQMRVGDLMSEAGDFKS